MKYKKVARTLFLLVGLKFIWATKVKVSTPLTKINLNND